MDWKRSNKLIKKIIFRILNLVGTQMIPNLWQKILLHRHASKNGCQLRFFPNAVWIIKKTKDRNLILKLHRDAYVPWHCIYFDEIFDSFEGHNRIIDLSVPSFLTMKSLQKEFFLFQAPEDDHVTKGYLAINKPNKNDIVFDVGAFCGVMSYVYSKLCKKVCAFEPNPYTYAALCTNIVHHKLNNVIPYLAGLWLKTGEVNFTITLGGVI